MCQQDLSADSGAELPPNKQQQFIASMQTGQDRQQNKQPFTTGYPNKNICTQIVPVLN